MLQTLVVRGATVGESSSNWILQMFSVFARLNFVAYDHDKLL